MFHQYESQLAQVHKEYGKEKNNLCEGSSQLLHWCVLFYRLSTANQCHSFSSLFPNKCTLFHAVQLILAWQHSVNKAVPCQTVNFLPFAHHLWILPEKQQATISGYWPARHQKAIWPSPFHVNAKHSWRIRSVFVAWESSQSGARFTVSSSGAFGQEANSDYLAQSWVILKCRDWRGICLCRFLGVFLLFFWSR